jgi:polyphosphate kinase
MSSMQEEDRYLNRELSWVDFNARVLTLAEDDSTPLLERVKFLAIFGSNLDEFYMVRVAGLKRQIAAGIASTSADGLLPQEQIDLIASEITPLVERHAKLFVGEIMPALAKAGIDIARWNSLDEDQKQELRQLFAERIFPIVTPLAVDPSHPFPYISNLSLNLAVIVRDPEDDRRHFARVKVPPLLDRFMCLSGGDTFVPLEDVIAANLDKLFPGMEIVEEHAFRVTRSTDFEVEDDEAENILMALEDELRRRRFSPAVRLEIEDTMPSHVLKLLTRELQISEQDVHALPGPLGLAGLWDLYALDRVHLKDRPFIPVTPAVLDKTGDEGATDIFSTLNKADVMVHHPYESFTASVQRFIEEAAVDPAVHALKMTLYRTSGESPIVEALIDAAEAGKQVVVLVEIMARFDERANIAWARALEKAGCHVVYGLVGLKTHCKLCLVVRQEGDRLRRYVHVGTGNYNPRTARIYEDVGLLTADQDLAADVSDLFNYLTGYSRQQTYRRLIVAPHGMREEIIDHICQEAKRAGSGGSGRIIMKLNSLVDERVIDSLYDASTHGVKVDLIIRGICALRPGVPGLSDNIRVTSILGRFLEHSRIFYFGSDGQPDIYIGSADMMHRNLDRRVETLVRIRSDAVKEKLTQILDVALSDNSSAWNLSPDGSWVKLAPDTGEDVVDLQSTLTERSGAHA